MWQVQEVECLYFAYCRVVLDLEEPRGPVDLLVTLVPLEIRDLLDLPDPQEDL